MIPLTLVEETANAFPPRRTPVPAPGETATARMGFFTDVTVCIGCKACEVACKQWNQLPADGLRFTGHSYDNTGHLGEATWRHVTFKEKADGGVGIARWLMMSDVCKHCERAPCVESCPTGSLVYNQFGNVYVQQDICNGCGYCVSACPFGVLGRSDVDGHAHKCTMCYDRQTAGLQPACAKVCPTASIQFGPVDELRERARARLDSLRERGNERAYLYGAEPLDSYGPTNAFFLLEDHPNEYSLPAKPMQPFDGQQTRYAHGLLAGLVLTAAAALFFRQT